MRYVFSDLPRFIDSLIFSLLNCCTRFILSACLSVCPCCMNISIAIIIWCVLSRNLDRGYKEGIIIENLDKEECFLNLLKGEDGVKGGGYYHL